MRSLVVSDLITASSTNILQSSILQTFPGPGLVTVEAESDKADGTNYFMMSLQLPDGQTPFLTQLVPANAQALAGVLVASEQFLATYQVAQGGHAVFSATMAGTAKMIYRITWRG